MGSRFRQTWLCKNLKCSVLALVFGSVMSSVMGLVVMMSVMGLFIIVGNMPELMGSDRDDPFGHDVFQLGRS